MVSSQAKMTVARVTVVLGMVASAVCLVALMRLPIFEYKVDELKSSITQSLFTTDIYTPIAEKHISVIDFTQKCPKLQQAFRAAQVACVAAIATLGLAFLCGLLHLAPTFTATNTQVRNVCGPSICLLLVLALLSIGLDAYVLRCLYENDTWCATNTSFIDYVPATHDVEPLAAVGAAPQRILRKDGLPASPPAGVATLSKLSLPVQVLVIPAAGGDAPRCNPFEDCVSNYRDMGFTPVEGYTVVWAALAVSIFALVVEMLVMAVGTSEVPHAGVSGETAALLGRDDTADRVI